MTRRGSSSAAVSMRNYEGAQPLTIFGARLHRGLYCACPFPRRCRKKPRAARLGGWAAAARSGGAGGQRGGSATSWLASESVMAWKKSSQLGPQGQTQEGVGGTIPHAELPGARN